MAEAMARYERLESRSDGRTVRFCGWHAYRIDAMSMGAGRCEGSTDVESGHYPAAMLARETFARCYGYLDLIDDPFVREYAEEVAAAWA